MEAITSVDDAQRETLRRLLADIETADGISPLNESGELIIAGQRPGLVIVAEHGFALLDPREGTTMLGVHPQHRRQGIGSALLAEALRHDPTTAVWAFGTRPGATELCARHGLSPQRELLKMARSLDPALSPPKPQATRSPAIRSATPRTSWRSTRSPSPTTRSKVC